MCLCGVEGGGGWARWGGGERTLKCARTSTLDARTLGHLHTRPMACEISCLKVSASHASTMHACADYNTNAGARPRIWSCTYARVKHACRLVRAGWWRVVTGTAPHSYVGPTVCTTGCRRLYKQLHKCSLGHARARTRARMRAPVNNRALVNLEKSRQTVLALFTQAKQCARVRSDNAHARAH